MGTDKQDLRIGHRERLRQNFLDGNLAKYELLELLLSYAMPRKDVRPLARMLFKKFGGIYPILSANIKDLMTVEGVGQNIATFIKVVQKVLLEGYQNEMQQESTILYNKEQLDNYCLLQLGGKDIEEAHVLYMDIAGRMLKDELHSTGSIDYTDLHIREIVKTALGLDAKFVILVHNHPKPRCNFSIEDTEMTKKIKQALELVNITLHDHYLVSGGTVYSMKAEFLI